MLTDEEGHKRDKKSPVVSHDPGSDLHHICWVQYLFSIADLLLC